MKNWQFYVRVGYSCSFIWSKKRNEKINFSSKKSKIYQSRVFWNIVTLELWFWTDSLSNEFSIVSHQNGPKQSLLKRTISLVESLRSFCITVGVFHAYKKWLMTSYVAHKPQLRSPCVEKVSLQYRSTNFSCPYWKM